MRRKNQKENDVKIIRPESSKDIEDIVEMMQEKETSILVDMSKCKYIDKKAISIDNYITNKDCDYYKIKDIAQWHLKQYEEAFKSFLSAINNSNSEKEKDIIKSLYKERIEEIKQKIKKDKDNYSLYMLLGNLYFIHFLDDHNLQDAIQNYSRYIEKIQTILKVISKEDLLVQK